MQPAQGQEPVQLNEEQLQAVRHPCDRPAVLIAGAGSGKLQPLDALVLGRYGWRCMGSLQVGEVIIDPTTGLQMSIVGIYPHPDQEVFQLTFDDGSSCQAGREHLWAYYISRRHSRKRERPSQQSGNRIACQSDFLRIGDTEYLRNALQKKVRIRIPLTEPVCHSGGYSQLGRGLSPYAIGLYLGDGTHASLQITNVDKNIREWIVSRGGHVKSYDKNQLDFDPLTKKSLRDWLRRNNLNGLRAWEKFLPEQVLTAPLEFRRELLRGLMDTDGWSEKRKNGLGFSSSSSRLAQGVQRLVWSLGGWASLRIKKNTFYSYKGKKCKGRYAYVLSIKMPVPSDCFKSSRKRKNCRKPQSLSRRLISIRSVGIKPVQCIAVDSIHGLYVTDDYIVTHNTSVMTERVRWLIDQGVPPSQICCAVFTNKAADELQSRLGFSDATPEWEKPRVSTIHSLALSFIKKDISGFGFPRRPTPIDDYDQYQIMRKIVEREKMDSVKPPVVLEKIRFHRARGVGFSCDYSEEIHEQTLSMHTGYHALDPDDRKLWGLYEKSKQLTNNLDFDDMLWLVAKRMQTDAAWQREIQAHYKHLLVDEAQDLSKIQWTVVEGLLASDNFNMYCVGDISQSVMGFNGSAPELLMQFSQSWRGTQPTVYKLARNHRSVPEIVKLANVIQSKLDAIPLRMESWRGLNNEHGETQLLRAITPQDIAASIASEIQRDNGTSRIAFRDNCILVRSAIQVRDLETEMVRRRIPYTVRGGNGLKDTQECRDLLAYLRLAVNPCDYSAFCRAVGIPRRGIGDVALESIRQLAQQKFEGNLLSAALSNPRFKLEKFVEIITTLSEFAASPALALDRCISMIDYETHLRKKYTRDRNKVEAKMENLQRLQEMLVALHGDGMDLLDILYLLTMDKMRETSNTGAVMISTIHAMKGGEARRVYVTNVVEGSLPHRFSMGNDNELQEEKRLFYVACTRARDILVICVHEMQNFGGKTMTLKPSRFLMEIGIKA